MDFNALSTELESDHRWLIRLARRLLRHPEAAEDLAQEASLLALRSPSLRESNSRLHVRSWLAKTAQHLAWNANRRARHEAHGLDALAREDRGDVDMSATERTERAEFRAAVATLVAELPPAEREAIVLRYYEGQSVLRIQEIVGAPSQEAVRKRLSRGIERLRKALDERLGQAEWHRAAICVTSALSVKKAWIGAAALIPTCILGLCLWIYLEPGAGGQERQGVPALAEVGFAVPHPEAAASTQTQGPAPMAATGDEPRRPGLAEPGEGAADEPASSSAPGTAPSATLKGRVRTHTGAPLQGAWVFTDFADGMRVLTGRMAQLESSAPPWADPNAVAGPNRAVTDEHGRFEVRASTSVNRTTRATLAVLSPGGDAGFELIKGLHTGDVVDGLTFTLRDDETLTLRLQSDGPGARSPHVDAAARVGAQVFWDELSGLDRSFMAGSSIASPLLPLVEQRGEREELIIARFHQPPRHFDSEELRGMLFLPGFQPASFTVEPGATEAVIRIEEAPRMHLRLDVEGEAKERIQEASIILTPEPPDPGITARENHQRVRSGYPFRQRILGWRNGETRAVPADATAPTYAYVALVLDSDEATLYLPTYGPLRADESTPEAPHLLSADLDEWGTLSGEEIQSAASAEAVPMSTIRASVVSAADGAPIPGAFMAVQGHSHDHGGAHSHPSGESGSVLLSVAEDEVALELTAPGFGIERLDPISLLPGETRDLGEIELWPLQYLSCRLGRATGGPLLAAHEVRYTDASGATRRAQADADGQIQLVYAEGPPTSVQIHLESGSSAPRANAPVVLQQDGTGKIAVPEWATVVVRVGGIPSPQRYLLDHLQVNVLGVETERPSTSFWPGFQGDDLLFKLQLPPGQWTIVSGKPWLVQLEPTTVEVPASPGPAARLVRIEASTQATSR
ncbi:RNA polymerase sigma factor [Planctomycetes bacterium Poly30]|uniref:RNA polymerase sigma factor n=1 Tax=Saltatorellus ferox TaxID=2528018 RepID=A0A518EV12_9BACT|nr:RNA polymerase sigma factor [Planctomycetes bacterium Poly30]